MASNDAITVEYKITVDSNGKAVVKADAAAANLRLNLDSVQFTSNDKRTVIRYRGTSPFAEPEVGPGKLLKIDSPKGPFKYVNQGKHHFDCGSINPLTNEFQSWGGTEGADTPG